MSEDVIGGRCPRGRRCERRELPSFRPGPSATRGHAGRSIRHNDIAGHVPNSGLCRVPEQIVEDYLQLNGYFTRHNVRFNPPRDHAEFAVRTDSVPSDIDIVGLHPRRTGPERVMVVSCKSWQSGFNATRILGQLRGELPDLKRPVKFQFRELWLSKWALGFRERIEELTGTAEFTYCIAVTKLTGNDAAWAEDATIQQNLAGNPFRFLTLTEMWHFVLDRTTMTPAPSEMGRLAQLLRAAGLESTPGGDRSSTPV